MFGKGMQGEANPMFGRKGTAAPRWKGGRKTRPDGYQRIVVPESYPHPCDVSVTGTKYALEHRVVMERQLGRYLHPTEVVHHIDRDPTNNDPTNLQLFASQSEHIKSAHGSAH